MSKVKTIISKLNPFPPVVRFIKNLFREEYTLDIWYPANQFGQRKHETYTLKKLTKISQTHMKGIGENGKLWELKTQSPFDYRIQRKF